MTILDRLIDPETGKYTVTCPNCKKIFFLTEQEIKRKDILGAVCCDQCLHSWIPKRTTNE